MKYKGVAKIYLSGGQIIEQPCDDVKVEMGMDGFVNDINYSMNSLKQDLVIKFFQRITVIAVTFIKNEES